MSQISGSLGVSGQFKTYCVCCVVILYGLCMPILIIKTRHLCSLFTSTFHILAGFRNQEVGHSHFMQRPEFISNFEKRGFGWNSGSALWISNGTPRTTLLDQWLRFLPHILRRNFFIEAPALLCMFHPFPPNISFLSKYYGYGCTMRAPILTHSTWISGTTDSPAPV